MQRGSAEETVVPKLNLELQTSASPSSVRAALLDFSDDRPSIWPGIEPSLYRVISRGDSTAEIQEGSRMPGGNIWARERYDWSVADRITWTVIDSNFCAAGSYVA